MSARGLRVAWFDSMVLGRVVANGRVIVLGNCGDRLASLLFARWGIEQGSRKIEMLPGLDFSRR